MSDALRPISSAEAARAFLEVRDEREVSALKMHKLVYVAHVNHIAETDMPFILDPIEAWVDGPVFPALHRFIGNSETTSAGVEALRAIDRPDDDVLAYAGEIWDHLKERSGLGLSDDAQAIGSPWHRAMNPPCSFFQRLIGWKPKHPIIEDAMIRARYRPSRGNCGACSSHSMNFPRYPRETGNEPSTQ